MNDRSRSSGDRRPAPPWLAAAVIGLTIQTIDSSAVMLGAGMALGGVVKRGA